MTKIKNTKKGMAKKTLSMSLVVAMLATSNVPVWAAEFSDGTDANTVVTAETPVVTDIATDEFTDVAVEAPVVEETNEVAAQATEESSGKYSFSNIKLKEGMTDFCWDITGTKIEAKDLFKDDSDIINSETGSYATTEDVNNNLRYAFRIGGSWDATDISSNKLNDSDLSYSSIEIAETDLKAAAGKTFEILIIEKDSNGDFSKIVKAISLGTIQKKDLNNAGLTFTITAPIYNGQEQKVTPTISGTVDGTPITADSFDWDFMSTATNYVDANATVTATGKLKTAIPGYTDTYTVKYTIQKRALAAGDIVVKLKNPGKDFTYENNANTEIEKSEVDVFLKDFSETEGTVASSISLNDYVKKVTVNTTAIGSTSVNVEFDSKALKASKNFNETAPTGVDSSVNAETKAEAADKTVDVVSLDLASCDVTLKSPVKADTNNTNVKNAIEVVVKKDGKTLNLSSTTDILIGLESGDYSTVGTFAGAVKVSGRGDSVTGIKAVDLVTVKQAFINATFENAGLKNDYLANKPEWVHGESQRSKALDYNNGKAVEFADMFTEKCVLGRFSPDGVSYGDQDNFRVTYENNINATNADSVAKMTITAIAGDYKGCSVDFYFRIEKSTVEMSTTKSENTVTTAVDRKVGGVSINEAYTSAEQYADAIGLTIKGTNGKTGDALITSEASSDDYTVKYSFVKAADHAQAGSNVEGDQIKVVATLKDNGNFKATNTTSGINFTNGVAGKITDNKEITLYVPIVSASVDTLDISLKEDTFTFTGEMIAPEVVVKDENGKVIKNAAKIVGISDGVNVGTATIKVSVDGYTGTKELTATINPAKLSDVTFEIKKASKDAFKYNGKQQKPTIAQEDDPTTSKDETVAETDAQADVKLGNVIISKMFDITYGKNIDAGKEAGSVTLTPKAIYAKNFEGTSITANFEILRAVLSATSVSDLLSIKDATGKSVPIDASGKINDKMNWTGEPVKFASVTVDDTKLTVDPTGTRFDDEDYELVYVNATDATGLGSSAYVAVVGKGNFKGEYSIVGVEIQSSGTVYTQIVPTEDIEDLAKSFSGLATITVLQSDIVEYGSAEYQIIGSTFDAKGVTYSNGTYAGGTVVMPNVSVKDSKTGEVLTEGKDYEIMVNSLLCDVTNAGTTKIRFGIYGLGKYKNSTPITKIDGKDLTYSIDKKDLKDCFVKVAKNKDSFDLTVMNGNIVEGKETFDVKDNGDGTATVTVVDGGKNYTGSVTVKIEDPNETGAVGTAMITDVKVAGNKATVVLAGEVENATGYDYVIATEEDYMNGRVDITKNQVKTAGNFTYVQEGTYYAYCHAWKRGADGKKVFGEWSNLYKFEVTAKTPSQPVITSVKVKGSDVTVTYTKASLAKGYDVVLGTASKKVSGEVRPVEYGTLVKKNIDADTVSVTFKDVEAGTYYVGLHAFNRTSADNTKVFSKWSNVKKVTVK